MSTNKRKGGNRTTNNNTTSTTNERDTGTNTTSTSNAYVAYGGADSGDETKDTGYQTPITRSRNTSRDRTRTNTTINQNIQGRGNENAGSNAGTPLSSTSTTSNVNPNAGTRNTNAVNNAASNMEHGFPANSSGYGVNIQQPSLNVIGGVIVPNANNAGTQNRSGFINGNQSLISGTGSLTDGTINTKAGTFKPKNININSTSLYLTNSNNFTEFKSKFVILARIGGYYDYLITPPIQHWEMVKARYMNAVELHSLYGWYRDNHQKISGAIQLAISPLLPNSEVIANEIEATYGNADSNYGNQIIDPVVGGNFTTDNCYYWWLKVSNMYERNTLYNTKVLFSQLNNLQCNGNSDVNIFINNFRSVWSQLNQTLLHSKISPGNVLPDDLYVILMEQCCSTNKEFSNIITILEQTDTLTPTNFETQLRLAYSRNHPIGVKLVNDTNKYNGANAGKAHTAVGDMPSRGGNSNRRFNKYKFKGKYNGNRYNNNSGGYHTNNANTNYGSRVPINDNGEYEFNCVTEEVNVESSDEYGSIAIGYQDDNSSDSDSDYNGGTVSSGIAYNADDAFENMWNLKLDSGATRHIISNPKLFISSTKPGFSYTVKGLMNTKATVSAIGSIRLTSNIIIHNVWYVKNAGVNLISLGRLLDDGAGVEFTITGASLLDGPRGKVIAKFTKVNTLFTLTHMSAPSRQKGYKPQRDLEWKHVTPPPLKAKTPIVQDKKYRRIQKIGNKNVNGGNGGITNSNVTNNIKSAATGTNTTSASANAREALQAARNQRNGNAAFITGNSESECYFAGNSSGTSDPCMQLHTKLGHVTINKAIATSAGIPYTNDITVNNCNTCLLTKTTRKRTGNGTYDGTKALFDKVSVDLIGPISKISNGQSERLPSNGGNLYILVILDEYSRFVWLRLLKTKSGATSEIINYINMIKTQYSTTIKTIHSDGGGEFRNHQLDEFYNANGIISTYTTVNSPFHNGGVERFNRTIKTTVTSMLLGSGVSINLWGEAVMYCGYVRNRTPLKRLQYKTPYEVLNGKSPTTNKIFTFGSDAYINTTSTERAGKFEAPATRGIYVGVSEQQNAIRILTSSGKITVSRDVKILDNRFEHVTALNTNAADAEEALLIWFPDEETEEEVEITEPMTIISNTNNSTVSGGATVKPPLSNDTDNQSDQPSSDDVADQYEPPLSPITENELESKYDDISHDNTSITNDSNTNDTTSTTISNLNGGTSTQTRTGRTIKPVTRYGSIDVKDLDPTSQRQFKRITGGAYAHYVSTENSIEIVSDNDATVYSATTNNSSGNKGNCNGNIVDPTSYKAAISSTNAANWIKSMKVELDALQEQQVLLPAVPPPNTKLLDTRWVFKTKLDEHNQISKFKSRLVVRGYSQEAGIDFFETFAPVSKGKTLKVLLSLAAQYKLKIKQLDFKNAFLNAVLPEDIYIKVPEGYDGNGVTAFKLNKSLYGLKQAPFLWYSTINELLLKLGYTNTVSDMCTYVKHVPNSNIPIIISLYVDDMLVLVPPALEAIWNADKAKISATYEIEDLGDARWILKMLITRDPATGTITLSQKAYVDMIVAKYYSSNADATTAVNPGMVSYDLSEPDTVSKYGATPLTTDERLRYLSIVGALGYLSNTTRIDIAYAVNMLQRNANNPTNVHMKCAINVIKYLKGTSDYGLVFRTSDTTTPFQITGYSDADFGGDKSTRKSTSGSVIMLNGNIVAWSSKKQPTVALSTMESEYVALVNASTDMLWIKSWLLEVLPTAVIPPMLIWCDNQSTVHILGKDNRHATTKHMDIKLHFIRNHINDGTINVRWISTVDQVADLLTKTIGSNRFQTLVSKLITTVKSQ